MFLFFLIIPFTWSELNYGVTCACLLSVPPPSLCGHIVPDPFIDICIPHSSESQLDSVVADLSFNFFSPANYRILLFQEEK